MKIFDSVLTSAIIIREEVHENASKILWKSRKNRKQTATIGIILPLQILVWGVKMLKQEIEAINIMIVKAESSVLSS